MSTLTLSDAQTSATPLNKKDRIVFLDAVRGMALLGILLMNSMVQGQSYFFSNMMNLHQPITGPNFYAWVAEVGLFEGTMRGLFSILFGAGTILLISRLEKTRGDIDAADIYYRRILWLLVFGLINAFIFLWPGDILYSYALCALALFPFRNMSPRKLLIPILFLLAFGTYRETSDLYDQKKINDKGRQAELLQKQHKKLTKDQTQDLQNWQAAQSKLSSKALMKRADEEANAIKNANLPKLFAHQRDISMRLQSVRMYNDTWLDVMIFFFTGMALFKSGYLTGNSRNWLYVLVAILGISIALTINYWTLKLAYTSRFDQIKITDNTFIGLYQIRRLIQTLGYLSLLILLYKITPFRKFLNLFSPVGQMAFTNYLSQSIIMGVIFYGFGWYGKLQRYEIYEVVAGVWLFQIIFSTIWLKYFVFGPFEWVWRSLTYLKLQPVLKTRHENVENPITEAAATN